MRTRQIIANPMEPKNFVWATVRPSDRPYKQTELGLGTSLPGRWPAFGTKIWSVPVFTIFQWTRTRESTKNNFLSPYILVQNSLYVSFRPKRSNCVERSKPLWAYYCTWDEKWTGMSSEKITFLFDSWRGYLFYTEAGKLCQISGVSWKIPSSTDITGLTLKWRRG